MKNLLVFTQLKARLQNKKAGSTSPRCHPRKISRRSVSFNLDANVYYEGSTMSREELKKLWPSWASRDLEPKTEKCSDIIRWFETRCIPHYLVWRVCVLLFGELLCIYYHRHFFVFTSLIILCEQLLSA